MEYEIKIIKPKESEEKKTFPFYAIFPVTEDVVYIENEALHTFLCEKSKFFDYRIRTDVKGTVFVFLKRK